jgi:hypothetical protein
MTSNISCRNCKRKKVKKIFDLGKLYFTGKFPSSTNVKLGKGELGLSFCDNCKLVQLNKSYDSNYLFSKDYGYKTGINSTMRNHMKNISDVFKNKLKLNNKDYILDIASNDGTLLNLFPRKCIKVGVDPILHRYKKEYKNVKFKISDFFSYKTLKKNKVNNKFKIITALSVFYDLNNPNSFLKDIEKILDDDGICLIENADLYSIIKLNMFDTICHEHVAYYSTKIMIEMANKNNLRIFDLKKNDINGGSLQYFICKKSSKFKNNYKVIKKILNKEKVFGLSKKETIENFYKRIFKLKTKTIKLFDKILKKNKKIVGYGASTKGNVLLQYYNIDKKQMKCIADRNPYKFGRYTPGTKIKIMSEKKVRATKPDYFFVLPWHFKKEILKREIKIRNKGTKMIFPLPNLKII